MLLCKSEKFVIRPNIFVPFSGLLKPNTKSSLNTEDAKSKLSLSSTVLSLSTSGSSSALFSSHGSLNLQSSSLLQQYTLSNPLLSTSYIKKDSTGSSAPSKSSLSSTLSRLTLKPETSSKNIFGSVEKKYATPTSNISQRASPAKSLSRKRVLKGEGLVLKKKVVEGKDYEATALVVKRHTVKPPDYTIRSDREDEFKIVNQSKFYVATLEVQSKTGVGKSLADVTAMKRGFINCVSGSLIAQPNLSNKEDPTRHQLLYHVGTVQHYDPEFVLKVALYCRKELGIRTTSNFLLALAANFDSTRQYLKKYFCASIALPSDWIEVAQIFQTLDDNNLKLGSLPAALRKAMIMKFTDFDEYQLAKYNKESSGKKKKAKEKKAEADKKAKAVTMAKGKRSTNRGKKFFESDSSDSEDENDPRKKAPFRQLSSVSYDEKVSEEALRNQRFTIKQLIRKLHIKEPVQYVMSIIGKKYPLTLEEFYQKRLPGTFDETKAGKRMKLAVPETWETQVSLKGNNAKTWEDLIDHKKLPFMAMLRNLRNLIKAGISMKHHNNILRRLTDQRSVVNSKQFPFRFFSAYVALNELEESYDKNQRDIIESALAKEQGSIGRGRFSRGRGTRGGTGRFGVTRGGVQKLSRGGKKGGQTEWWLREISVLMGLMCKYACEECEFLVFNENNCQEVQLQPGTILDNMDTVLKAELSPMFEMVKGVPYSVLLEKLRDRVEVDNLLIFGENFYPTMEKGIVVNDFLRNYRHMVNPNLLFVSVTFSSPRPGFALNVDPSHHNDVYISGYSDALLRFVAERGDTAQVNHVDKIDVAFQLRPMPNAASSSGQKNSTAMTPSQPDNTLPLITPTPRWRTIRVFISSTFRDMHGERDLLTRFVFPELRSLAQRMFINVYEVDLRWGITEEQSKDNRALEVCLQEVSSCQLFVGLLGERYGWTPDSTQVPDIPEYDWVRAHPAGASITELEMHLGALSKADHSRDTAFFFIRDNTFEKDVPSAFLSDFRAESEVHKSKLASLKQKILNSGLEVYDKYPCHWGGCVSGKPIVAGLEDFGSRVLNSLISAVKKLCPEEDNILTEEEHNSNLQWAFVESLSSDFVGRKNLVDQIISKILNTQSGILGLIGKMGSGKTALMASTILQYTKLKQVGGSYGVFLNFTGSSPGSGNLAATIRRLAQQVNTRFGLGRKLPEDFKNLTLLLQHMLEEAANICPSRLVFFLDGIDLMDTANQPTSLDWLPSPLPENVVFVITGLEGQQTHKSLKRLKAHEITVAALQIWDKSELVRTTLARHRKTLNESGFGNQMKILMLKKEASNPLYLKLACEELRVFGVFEKISDKLKELPHTTAQMLQEVLTRLEEDHGVENVSSALRILSCVRDDEFQNFAMEKSLCNGNLILIGNFNIHVENENNSQGKWLMELFYSLNLEQHICEPTHDGGHTLDLLVTPKNNSFIKFDKVDECHFSDHKSIHFIISAKKPKPSRKTLKYRKTKNNDIEAFKRSKVEAEVSKKVEAGASVNEKINVLSNTISNVLEAHAPQKVKSIVYSTKL
ncbi:telomerase protein component 1 [Elysia marginata]|uniref:Telomerase protein component 1 n=1 Tax=Elysia marginata TaxID=1093978 RepID=A0AAV4JQ59_9GAST|nr:telomerase protein component 1 [Elysia marginata]